MQTGTNWQRLKYDQGNYQKSILQSVAPLARILDPISVHNCAACNPDEVGYLGRFGVSYDSSHPLVDTESELRNITRKASRDPNKKYLPQCSGCGVEMPVVSGEEGGCSEGYPAMCQRCQPKLFHFTNCDVQRESTRLSNPTFTLRETGVNRFQPTYIDHQDPTHWELQGEVGINYRMIAKDNHVPCVPKPMDQMAVWPQQRALPVKTTVNTKANPIESVHPLFGS